jgi:RNase P subunit RPR2
MKKLNELSQEELSKLVKEGVEKGRKYSKSMDKSLPPSPRLGHCKVCSGVVTEEFYRKFDATNGPLVIGPGSKSQFYWASKGLHCADCGLLYYKLPG